MSERVSSQIADSVTQAGGAVLDEAASVALGQSYLAGAQGSASLYANLVAEQQQYMLTSQAAANAAVRRFLEPPRERPEPAPEPEPEPEPDREPVEAVALPHPELYGALPEGAGAPPAAEFEKVAADAAELTAADQLAGGPAAQTAGESSAEAEEAARRTQELEKIYEHSARLLDTIDRLTGSLSGFVGRTPVVY
ncbi:Killing trait domain-containing protein [Tistlia consotensis]|uniref:Killing trait domain-containing protein n=1 Tax=Tistlia consotensis USBA 355 TaxID=560819 RepID=A0A1Y6BNJ3_9PROT|nr:RebB family R body protein [Tistlia consotensis]SMF09971.1 Killing trait domain-containing protein [Tistlia consotensis USBA 355]SNR34108.1 Killing trait domain-containing protein [Tistlia consotensis]